MTGSILRSMIVFPLTAGHVVSQNPLQRGRDGKIASIILMTSLFSITVSSTLILGALYKQRFPHPSDFLWALYSLKNLASFICVVVLCVVLHKKRHNLLKLRKDFSSSRKIFCLWLFGFGHLLHNGISISIDVQCAIEEGKHVFKGEEALGILSRLISVAFLVSELGFVSLFSKYKLLSTKLTNYLVYFVLSSNLTEWVKTSMRETFHLKHPDTHQNGSHSKYYNSCYPNSKIKKFHDKHLEPYLLPMQTEYSLLVTLIILEMISTEVNANHQSGSQKIETDDQFKENVEYQSSNSLMTRASPAEECDLLLHPTRKSKWDLTLPVQRHGQSNIFFVSTVLFLCVPFIVVTILAEYVSADISRVVHLLFVFCFLLVTLCAFHSLRIQCEEEKRKPISSGEWLLVFSSFIVGVTRVFSFAAYLLSSRDHPVDEKAFLLNHILVFINTFLQTILILQANRCRRVFPDLNSTRISVERCLLMLHILNVSTWLATAYAMEHRIETSMDEIEVYGRTDWGKVMRLVWPVNVFFCFHSSMDLYGLYRKLS